MVFLRVLAAFLALLVALVPVVAWADQGDDEVANAVAQLALAEQEANALRQEGRLSAANDRTRALIESAEFRNTMLANTANGNAIEAISAALANAARQTGEFNATNELVIAHGRAQVLLNKIQADLANARAIGRPDEVRNAEAQASLMQAFADAISGTMAETAMSSSRLTGEVRADAIHTPGISQATNSRAMGAQQLLQADVALAAGELAALNSLNIAEEDAADETTHEKESLENAIAQNAFR